MYITDPQNSPLKNISDINGQLAYRGQLISGSAGTGSSNLPANATGYLYNDGNGNLSWQSNTIPILDPITQEWVFRVYRGMGELTSGSQVYANNLILNIKNSGIQINKFVRLDAWLGNDLYTAACFPLIDRLNKGSQLINTINNPYHEQSGVYFTGVGYINTFTKPSELNIYGNNNGGLGWWEGIAENIGNGEPLGCANYSDNRFSIDVRVGLPGGFRWGGVSKNTQPSNGRFSANYYGQRNSPTNRTLYISGIQIGTNTTNDTTPAISSDNIALGGSNYYGTIYPWSGLSKLSYLTNGEFTTGEIYKLHFVFDDWLKSIGRI